MSYFPIKKKKKKKQYIYFQMDLLGEKDYFWIVWVEVTSNTRENSFHIRENDAGQKEMALSDHYKL